ncbi:O-antigen ligase family protein [Acinetobacter sp. Leaf130]|uniref:O-antigen ligase family protein n=1 Tax=Acinetobacter sp. Leaf130 TaxID=1736269 RepID=UPI000A8457B1|nr:O-antigen ligase family protein [Acinetobacter sp. Leaf130]
MKFFVFIILLSMIYFLKNASVSLLLYGFFAADRDGYAFLEFLSLSFPNFKLYTRVLFLILFLYSVSYLFFSIKKINRVESLKLFSVLLVSFLITFNSLFKGDDIIWAISLLVFSGVPVYFIWYVMGVKNNNNEKFINYVVIKTIIATIILLTPSLMFLDGSFYKAEEGIFVNDVSEVNFSAPTGTSIKGAYSRYSIYHNPNSLGFHSVLALLVAVYLFMTSGRLWEKLLAVIVFFCGLIGWLNSLTRGPMLFFILGLFYIAILNVLSSDKKNFLIKFIIIFSSVLLGMLMFVFSDISKYLIPDQNDISVVDRVQGYIYSFSVIKDHFWLGVGKGWDWNGYYPHFLPLSLTADNGIFVGLVGGALVFLGGTLTVVTASKNYLKDSSNRAHYFLSIMLVFLVFGIAITNNFTAPVIFWIMLAQADILNKKFNFVKRVCN